MRKNITIVVLILVIAGCGWLVYQQVLEIRRIQEIHAVWHDREDDECDESYEEDYMPDYSNLDLGQSVTQLPRLDVQMVPVTTALQTQWPRWRGASGQGLAVGSGYVSSWSDEENMLWKVDLPGTDHSAPIVVEDQIFLTAVDEQGPSIVCLGRGDGQQLWEATVPDGSAEQEPLNGLASSTPCTDGQRVYAHLGSQGLLCVDMQGKQVWQRLLEVSGGPSAMASSPLLYEDRLIIFQDQPGDAFVAAFDAATGQPLWNTTRPGGSASGAPVAIRAGDRDLIIVSSVQEVSAYDPQTGVEVWQCEELSAEAISTPVAGMGMLFCSGASSGATFAIHPGGLGDVSDSHVVWSVGSGDPLVSSPLLLDGYLYLASDAMQAVRCYDAKTGKTMWQERLELPQVEATAEADKSTDAALPWSSPVAVEDKIFFTNRHGQTAVLQAGPEFQLLGVNQLNAPLHASPALVEGKWYFCTDKQLLCIGQEAE